LESCEVERGNGVCDVERGFHAAVRGDFASHDAEVAKRWTVDRKAVSTFDAGEGARKRFQELRLK
jgi:hypothetical protein